MSGNLIVVAGAGTGKTHTLVQECLARLDQGVGIEEMLVVTFTKAAAAELRERIATELQKRFAEQPDSAQLARQIAMLDRAQISTLHSFCLELVSRHFSELGLSPRLVTLEASQAAVLRNEALDLLFETYYDAKTAEAKEARQLPLAGFMLDTTQRLRSPSLPPRELELFSSARCDYLGRMFKDLIFAFPLNPSVFLTARIGFTRSSRMDIASGWSAAARACA